MLAEPGWSRRSDLPCRLVPVYERSTHSAGSRPRNDNEVRSTHVDGERISRATARDGIERESERQMAMEFQGSDGVDRGAYAEGRTAT